MYLDITFTCAILWQPKHVNATTNNPENPGCSLDIQSAASSLASQ